jgi:hypothetical protein
MPGHVVPLIAEHVEICSDCFGYKSTGLKSGQSGNHAVGPPRLIHRLQ